MGARDFVRACKAERDAMLAIYADPSRGSAVAEHLKAANLTHEQRLQTLAAIDAALTDAFYTILLALDGSASLGGIQQSYRLQDEAGLSILPDKDLEPLAYEALRSKG